MQRDSSVLTGHIAPRVVRVVAGPIESTGIDLPTTEQIYRETYAANIPVRRFSLQGTAVVRPVSVSRSLLWVGSLGGSLALGQKASSAAQARRADEAAARPIRMGTTVRNGGSGVVVPVLAAREARSGWLSAAFWLRSTTTRPEAVHRFRM